MNTTKIVGSRKEPRTPAEFHALGAKLDRELSVVRPFPRKRGFVLKARTWDELAEWEAQRAIQKQRKHRR